MRQVSKGRSWKFRMIFYGVLPCVLGVGFVQYLGWSDVVWLSDTGRFWPVVLSLTSAAILTKLSISDFEETTSAVAAWLTLIVTWFYVPAWAFSTSVPYTAAVVSRSGDVHHASEATPRPDGKVWLLSRQAGLHIVKNVAGTLNVSEMDLEYRYSDAYIAGRRHEEDLSDALMRSATSILGEQARGTRASRIALLQNRAVQDSVLAKICEDAVGNGVVCPLQLRLSPIVKSQGLGATWSKSYTEAEAAAEQHLPTLLHLLTQPDSTLGDGDRIFRLFLDLARSVEPLIQVAQRSALVTDPQFDELIRRILAVPGCSEGVVAIVATVTRLRPEQRAALRDKMLAEAAIPSILENANKLRLKDAEIVGMALRMRQAFEADARQAVKALAVFGERLSPAMLHDAEAALLKARPSYAIAAMEHINFAPQMRSSFMQKIVTEASVDDFAEARLGAHQLHLVMTPHEVRALAAMAVRRSETSSAWLDFILAALPMRIMTSAERQSVLNGLLFKNPKEALEFVSKNRTYLAPAEVNEVTRDYTRTITGDFCLHLSHRNNNWRTVYFSEDQLQIFRDCAHARMPKH